MMTNSKIVRKPAAPVNSSKAASAKPKAVAPQAETPGAKREATASGKAQRAAAAKPRHKLVRDSFTIPKSEYAVLEALKVRATNLKRPTKKSEMLRAGIAALRGMTDKAFLTALNGVPSLKTGRPIDPELRAQPAKKSAK